MNNIKFEILKLVKPAGGGFTTILKEQNEDESSAVLATGIFGHLQNTSPRRDTNMMGVNRDASSVNTTVVASVFPNQQSLFVAGRVLRVTHVLENGTGIWVPLESKEAYVIDRVSTNVPGGTDMILYVRSSETSGGSF